MSANVQAFDLAMFDLDGTLVATAGEIGDAVNDTLVRPAGRGNTARDAMPPSRR